MIDRLNDLSRHYRAHAAEIDDAVKRVLASGWYVNGRERQAFEREFAAYCGIGHCIGVGNGTDALEIALRSLGVGAGDEVLTVANAGGFSSVAIRAAGGTPVFVDIDPVSLTMSRDSLARVASRRSKAVIVTHTFGRLADIDALLAEARRLAIPLIEDCAQAHGAARNGRMAGAWGDAACFSFYPAKNLGALGDGGAVATDRPEIAERARMLSNYGWAGRYQVKLAGGRNSRLDELQAAILRAKLPHLAEWNAKRRQIAAWYAQRIKHPDVRVPAPPGPDDVVHLYVVRVPDRDSLASHLARANVPFAINYPVADPMQEAWADESSAGIPVTVAACAQVLTLPCFPEMELAEVRWVADAVNSWRSPR